MKKLTASFKKGQIELNCIRLGADYQIIVSGGQAHIGASAVAVCYDRKKKKVNVSQIAVYGHKEDELAQGLARKLSRATGATVAVTAGIHFDQLAKSDISQIMEISDNLLDRLIIELGVENP